MDLSDLKAHDIMQMRKLVLCLPSDSLEAICIVMRNNGAHYAVVVNTHEFEKQEFIGIVKYHRMFASQIRIDPEKSNGIEKVMIPASDYPIPYLMANPDTPVEKIIQAMRSYKSSFVVVVERRWCLEQTAYPVGIIDSRDIINVIGEKLQSIMDNTTCQH